LPIYGQKAPQSLKFYGTSIYIISRLFSTAAYLGSRRGRLRCHLTLIRRNSAVPCHVLDMDFACDYIRQPFIKDILALNFTK
jgi:hypothetical protein